MMDASPLCLGRTSWLPQQRLVFPCLDSMRMFLGDPGSGSHDVTVIGDAQSSTRPQREIDTTRIWQAKDQRMSTMDIIDEK